MAIKMRVVYYSKNMKALAEALSDGADVKADTVPPAYNIEKMKLLIVCTKSFKTLPDDLGRFLGGLDKTRSANVAFIVDGADGTSGPIVDRTRNAGTNVIANTLFVKSNLFGKISDADLEKAKAWKEELIASLS